MVELYRPSPIRLHGMVLNYLNTETNSLFYDNIINLNGGEWWDYLSKNISEIVCTEVVVAHLRAFLIIASNY
jgi:hypothetical protein